MLVILATIHSIYGQLLDIGFDKLGTIIALGGSVVDDIAGFVAATFMRGVNLGGCPRMPSRTSSYVSTPGSALVVN